MNNIETYIKIAEEQLGLAKRDNLSIPVTEHVAIALDNLVEAVKVLARHAGIAASILFILGIQALGQCGQERIKVKDLADKDVATIHMQPVPATVAELITRKPPVKIGNDMPRQDSERQVYEASVWVIGYKHEADGDYHVVISTPNKPKETMIFEIPDPNCAPGNYEQTFKQQRAFIDSLGGAATPAFKTLKQPAAVKVKFVLFWDKCHGQTGRAPNCVEGHPGLGMEKN